jgi:Spy/CpxP family protein refolding chaperone
LAAAAVAAGVISVSALAIAEPMQGGWHHGGGGMELLHGLSLTDAQKEQVKSIEQADREQMRPVMHQLHSLHEQIETGLLSGATADQLGSLVQQEETLRNQMDAAHLGLAVQIRGVLTPEQLTQASTQHAKLVALHEQEHELMRGGEPPAQ